MSTLLKKLFKWEREFRKVSRAFKGSLKDPFCYLGIGAVILFLVLSFTPHFFSDINNSLSFDFLQLTKKEGPFVGLIKSQPESPNLNLIQKSSLIASVPPVMVTPQVLGTILGEPEPETKKEIIEYIVKEGDSLWSISNKFNISINTIVWANDIKSALIKPGKKLLILPVTGVMHLVKEGDSVSELAKKYKTDPEKIIAFNDLTREGDLFGGEVLIIPDGTLPFYSEIQPVALSRLSTNDFYGQSHKYPYGYCTWWVAQKRAIPGWGHAKNWLDNAIASGFKVCRGSYCIPQVGAVISVKGAPGYGHVGYVEKVKGDKVIFSEMNYIGFGRMNYRSLKIGDPAIKGYIY